MAVGWVVAKIFVAAAGRDKTYRGTVESFATGDEDDGTDCLWKIKFTDGDEEEFDIADLMKYAIGPP